MPEETEKRKRHLDLQLEMAARQAKNKNAEEKCKLQKKLQKLDPGDLTAQFLVQRLENCSVVGQFLCHVWTVNGSFQTYNRKIEKLKVNQYYKSVLYL